MKLNSMRKHLLASQTLTSQTLTSQTLTSQKGQSLTETLVVSLALVPLLFLGIYIGKLADIQIANGSAARKLAFDCVQRREDCKDIGAHADLVDASRRQFMTAPGREILSMDGLQDEATVETTNPLWTTRTGSPLLEKFSDVSAQVTTNTLDAPGSRVSSSGQSKVSNAAELLSNIAGPGRFGFDLYGGFITAKVQTKLSQDAPSFETGARLDPFPLTMQRHVAILSDEWNASGASNGRADSVKNRVDKGQQLYLVGPIAEAALAVSYSGTRAGMAIMDAISIEKNTRLFRWHDVDVSIIPPDRKKGGAAVVIAPPPPILTGEGD
jgi:hypothetical protein